MPVDAAKASTGQLGFLIVCYLIASVWCGVLAIRGTRSWTKRRDQILGGIAAAVGIGYALYLIVALIRHAGFLPLGFIGLLIPGGMILNAYRYDILGRRRTRRR